MIKIGRPVKCKICGEKIDKDIAYCVEKISEKTSKITRNYYCSKEEYEKNKEEKGLWLSKY